MCFVQVFLILLIRYVGQPLVTNSYLQIIVLTLVVGLTMISDKMYLSYLLHFSSLSHDFEHDWFECLSSLLGTLIFGGKFCSDSDKCCTLAKSKSVLPSSSTCKCDRKNFDTMLWSCITCFQESFELTFSYKFTLHFQSSSIYWWIFLLKFQCFLLHLFHLLFLHALFLSHFLNENSPLSLSQCLESITKKFIEICVFLDPYAGGLECSIIQRNGTHISLGRVVFRCTDDFWKLCPI